MQRNGRIDGQSPFELWLRTGRATALGAAPECKFNPWHDPEDGRFTFRNAGQYFGAERAHLPAFRGGGGDYGGGGAQSSWPKGPSPPSRRRVPQRQTSVAPAVIAAAARARAAGPRNVHLRNGYRFETDPHQRTLDASGYLTLGQASPPSRTAQARAGGSDRRRGDDGGHYIAHRFNGPSDGFNHVAQSARFNRGAYRAIEDKWARARRAGHVVWVHIVPTYSGTSQRPSSLRLEWRIDGLDFKRTFVN